MKLISPFCVSYNSQKKELAQKPLISIIEERGKSKYPNKINISKLPFPSQLTL